MSFIIANWPQILLVVGILINVLNATTTHFGSKKGVVKVISWIVSVLSILASVDVPGALKLPLVPEKAPEVKE